MKKKNLFITFGDIHSKIDNLPFALNFIISLGYDVIGVNHNSNHYQELSLEKFKQILSPYALGLNTYTYGYSLGGYCALYYASAFQSTAISMAPRNSIDPIMIEKFGKVFPKLQMKHDFFSNIKTSERAAFIFLDLKYKKDLIYFNERILGNFKKTFIINCHGTRHSVLRHLVETKQIKEIFKSILDNKEIEIDDNLKSSVSYFLESKSNFLNKNYLKAKEIIDQGILIYPKSKDLIELENEIKIAMSEN